MSHGALDKPASMTQIMPLSFLTPTPFFGSSSAPRSHSFEAGAAVPTVVISLYNKLSRRPGQFFIMCYRFLCVSGVNTYEVRKSA